MRKNQVKKIIFTDLDETLLDKNYSYKKALPALKLIKKNNVPLIICTSKTRAEIEVYRKKLKNEHPFISENGAAIFIPKKYFNFKFKYNKEDKKYFIIELGIGYKKLVEIVKELKKRYKIRAFYEMTSKEIAKETGLPLDQAKKAKKREYDEVIKIIDSTEREAVLTEIKNRKINYLIGGRYIHINKSNKGKAVQILIKLFKKKYGKIITIALGDSKNDFDMLDKVDKPYLVMKSNRRYASNKYIKAGAIGPEGWNKVIIKELSN